ncbi:hypothetical protein V8B97DRAFT_2003368 [Scleroderma yunnanense]
MSRSPISPASTCSTPHTPLSLCSLTTPPSSTITTPGSVTSLKRFPVVQSLECDPPLESVNKGLADVALNWRLRANENGIKVALSSDASFGDDEASELTPSDSNSATLVNEEAPYLMNHRRSRTQSNISLQCAPTSPQAHRTPARRTLGILNTPPQKATSSSQLKFKGSFTDPAHTRRRPSFGQISTELFDIDENAFEPYPQTFSAATQPLALQDPFHGSILSTIVENLPHSIPTSYPDMYTNVKPFVPTCLVCGRSGGRLVIIDPCKHAHCNACFTSALNIVGEKDMECAVCKASVVNFAFHTPSDYETVKPSASPRPSHFSAVFDVAASPIQPRSFRGHPPTCPNVPHLNPLPSLLSAMSFYDNTCDLSPTGFSSPLQKGENIVLRIDNVPWDITPPVIAAWLKHPVVRVHVLLDPRGKTLSHAYVELATEDIAKAALRDAQNSVLGKGKRARGVTVTRSSQEELMRALFPSWKGAFDGSRPSLSGLGQEHLAVALTNGLTTIAELEVLMHLIQSPDSRFLKAPSLPFYFLISILSKFPADVESRACWSTGIRDTLFDALGVLAVRVRDGVHQDDPELFNDFLQTSVSCQAFTPQQVEMLKTVEIACQSALTTAYVPQNCHFSAVPAAIPESPYSALAKEFGINEELVQALAHRLGDFY